ncbi:Cupredoxin [Coemansia mojavensis]|nr:Cupredoxin [Coemansia mojavensis]
MLMQIILCYSVAIISTLCYGKQISVFWDVGYVDGSRDGYYTRRSIGVNGTSPIPPIYATQGDNLQLTIRNSLDVPTSIHAHGIYQNGTSYLDGTGMVSQCGILPGKTFTYQINTQQAGTFLVYGSNDHQEADGLRTALVIRSLKPRFTYDEDMLITLEDWYPKTFHQKMDNINKPGVVFPPPPSYATGLVNGFNGNHTKPLRFSPGKQYRLDVASMAVTVWFKFTIPGHKLTIVEADGVETEPYSVDGLDLGPKQRYSVIVNAKPTAEFNYIYNATLYANFIPKWPGMNPRYYTGIVEYKKGASIKNYPLPDDTQLEWSEETKLLASDHQPLLEPVNRQIELSAELFKAADGSSYFVLDKLPFATSKVPTLYSAMTMGNLAQNSSTYGLQANAHILNHLEIVQVTIHNPSELYRSFHLHGHSFQVIKYGPAKDTSDDVERPIRVSTKWPLRRDTVTVASYESVTIRFKADNPGVWLLRCTMSTHYYLGLAMTFIEAPDVLQQRQTIPFELEHMCRQQNIATCGNAAGNSGLDLAGLPSPPVRNQTNS